MGIDLEKFADDLDIFNDDINGFVLDNKYNNKYLKNIEIDGDFQDNRLEEFVNNVKFESKFEFLNNNNNLYQLVLGHTDILEIMEFPSYDDLKDENYIDDLNEDDFEEIEDKFMEFKSLNQKELLDELNRFTNEATKYVTKHKLELDNEIDPSFFKR